MENLKYGQIVRVVRDYEVPEEETSDWVGAIGRFVHYRDGHAIVQFHEDQIPEYTTDDSLQAWFSDEELEVLEPEAWAYDRLAESKRHRSPMNKAVRKASHNIILGTQSEFYWKHSTDVSNHEDWAKAGALSSRYLRFKRHMTEVAPGWQNIAETYYADNSVELTQISENLRFVRRVMTKPPSGDICF